MDRGGRRDEERPRHVPPPPPRSEGAAHGVSRTAAPGAIRRGSSCDAPTQLRRDRRGSPYDRETKKRLENVTDRGPAVRRESERSVLARCLRTSIRATPTPAGDRRLQQALLLLAHARPSAQCCRHRRAPAARGRRRGPSGSFSPVRVMPVLRVATDAPVAGSIGADSFLIRRTCFWPAVTHTAHVLPSMGPCGMKRGGKPCSSRSSSFSV